MNEEKSAESEVPTAWAVNCYYCMNKEESTLRYMIYEFYADQMRVASSRWICPRCFQTASWNDENYDNYYEQQEKEFIMNND